MTQKAHKYRTKIYDVHTKGLPLHPKRKMVHLRKECGNETRYITRNVQRNLHGNRYRHQNIKKNLSQTSHTNTDLISVESTDSNDQISAYNA